MRQVNGTPPETINTPETFGWQARRREGRDSETYSRSGDLMQFVEQCHASRSVGQRARAVGSSSSRRMQCETNGFIALPILRHMCVYDCCIYNTHDGVHRLRLQDAHVAYEQHTNRIQLPHSIALCMHMRKYNEVKGHGQRRNHKPHIAVFYPYF